MVIETNFQLTIKTTGSDIDVMFEENKHSTTQAQNDEEYDSRLYTSPCAAILRYIYSVVSDTL